MAIQDSDAFLVARNGTNYQTPASNLMAIQDTDLLAVNRGGINYKVTGDEVKTYVNPLPTYLGLTWTEYATLPEGGLWTNLGSAPQQSWAGRQFWYADSSDTAICYVSSQGNVFRTTDLQTWTQVLTAPSQPTQGEDVRLVSAGDGVWAFSSNSLGRLRSLDDGLTWQSENIRRFVSADRYNNPGILYSAESNGTSGDFFTVFELTKSSSTPTQYSSGISSTNRGFRAFCVSSSPSGTTFAFSHLSTGSSTTDIDQSLSPTGPYTRGNVYHLANGSAPTMVPISQGGVGLPVNFEGAVTVTFQTRFLAVPTVSGPWGTQPYTYNGWVTTGVAPAAAAYADVETQGIRFSVFPQPEGVPVIAQSVGGGSLSGPIVPWNNQWVYFATGSSLFLQS